MYIFIYCIYLTAVDHGHKESLKSEAHWPPIDPLEQVKLEMHASKVCDNSILFKTHTHSHQKSVMDQHDGGQRKAPWASQERAACRFQTSQSNTFRDKASTYNIGSEENIFLQCSMHKCYKRVENNHRVHVLVVAVFLFFFTFSFSDFEAPVDDSESSNMNTSQKTIVDKSEKLRKHFPYKPGRIKNKKLTKIKNRTITLIWGCKLNHAPGFFLHSANFHTRQYVYFFSFLSFLLLSPPNLQMTVSLVFTESRL